MDRICGRRHGLSLGRRQKLLSGPRSVFYPRTMSASQPRGVGRRLRVWIRRHVGVRWRLTAAAAVVVAATVAVGGVALVLLLGRSLEHAADVSASQRVQELVSILRRHGLHAAQQGLLAATGESTIAQIVNSDHRVVASSSPIAGEPPLTGRVVSAGGAVHEQLSALPVGDGAAYRVVSQGVRTSGGDYQVIAAQSLAAEESSVRTVSAVLFVGVPILALVAGGVTSVFVGRSLRPVEWMRQQVSVITAQDLSRRVPVPEPADELGRLADTMNGMLERLQLAQETQQRFVADASHELRSPLAAIKANLQIADSHPGSVDWPETHATMIAETTRLEHIIADLLILAQADDSGLRLRLEDVDLDDLIQVERNRLRTTTRLEIGGTVAAVRSRSDRHRLSQVVRNLTDNAAAHARTRVDITLYRHAGSAVIEVTDDGLGVPDHDRDRIFERFVRLDDSRARSNGGTGLGLAIVREVVRAHRGAVEVIDNPAGGACFRVTLPL